MGGDEEGNNNNKTPLSLPDQLSLEIELADRLTKSALDAESSKLDCSELAKHSAQLNQLLRSLARITTTHPLVYPNPLRRILSDTSKTLTRALALVRKCKHSSALLRQVFAIATTADFRKINTLLLSSAADVKWLLSIFDSTDTSLSLPPMASNDPILAWVWSYIATLQMSPNLKDRIDAAYELASLSNDNHRNTKIIVQEGGIAPLLRLLKEGASADAEVAAATALFNLGSDGERVRLIAAEMGVCIVVQAIGGAPMRVQVVLVDLVGRMAELDDVVKEDFGRENVIRPLVTLLGMDMVFVDEPKNALAGGGGGKPTTATSIHSLVKINKELLVYNSLHSTSSLYSDGSSRGGRKERQAESPELKLRLKVACAGALWKLSKGSLLNSRKITETKALICLAKIIEKERGELQMNCLMTIMELAAVAESNAELRRVAFKRNSPAARAVLEQLLRLIDQENSPALLIPTIKSIGSLARTFPAKETQVIGPLVSQLGHRSADVAAEVAVALGKFVCPDNFNCVEHSKAIVECNGVQRVINLLKSNERGQRHELVLLCYLALNVGNNPAFGQERALNVIEGAARSVVAQYPDLRELFVKAVNHLTLYQAGAHVHRHAYAP